MNVLKPEKKAAIITLLKQGVSQREISEKTDVDRKTIRKYAEECCLSAKHITSETRNKKEEKPEINQEETKTRPAQNKEKTKEPKKTNSACEPYREWIEKQLRLGRNAVSIYQDLVELHGFENKYDSVKRFVRKWRKKEPKQYEHLDFPPGEEAQVDYGLGAKTLYKDGRYKKPRLFVMTLKYSGRSFRKTVWKSSQEVWSKLHEEAFWYFKGCTIYVVLDNLKEGVITPDIYEPEINSVYASVLKHYGVVADTARVGDANRKGSVENAVKHTQNTALKGRTFQTIEEQNEWLMHWEERWAKNRIHGSKKRQVEEMFIEEKPYLKELPMTRFRYFKEGSRTVWDDGNINVDNSYYSALPAKLYSKVMVRIYETEIEIFDPETLNIIRRHPKSNQAGSFIMEEKDRIFNPSRKTGYLLELAGKIGTETQKLCQMLFNQFGRSGQRRMQGIVNLARNYESRYIEQAATLSIKNGLTSYKSFKKLVQTVCEKELESQSEKPEKVTQKHKLIRPMEDYAQFFKQHAAGADSVLEKETNNINKSTLKKTLPQKGELQQIWQNADWNKVIDVFDLEIDNKRRRHSEEIWIKSPFTNEENASLHLNTKENIFKDFSSGRGAGEGILNFCQELLRQRGRDMNCYEVGRWMLETGISTIYRVKQSKTQQPSTKSSAKKAESLEKEINQPIKIDLRKWLRASHPALLKRGVEKETCQYLGCGFLEPRSDGNSPLNGRIVFQIRGVFKKGTEFKPVILSHVGRALTVEQERKDGKYWSYPFFKGFEIYNQDNLLLDEKARKQVEKYGLILVEGYFDVAALVAAGILNVGAIMGSELTSGQVSRLEMVKLHLKIPKITLFLDRDKAGVSGSEKSALLLLKHSFTVAVFNWNNQVEIIENRIRDPGEMMKEQLKMLRKNGKI